MRTIFILIFSAILKMISFDQVAQPPPTPHFIAMEYKGLSNCIMKIYITDSLIMGAKVNGYIACAPNFGIGTTVPLKHIREPEAYIKKKLDAYDSLLTDESAFLKKDRYNFIIRRSDVKKIWHDPTHKWGMGYYPDTGKICLESSLTSENKETVRELILVGNQNARSVLEMLNK
ncbi:MAG: hypothetical protein M3N30_03675 [Bacteroidota bacterium]|nr:hypothetical protein [Bacteroidota bacterium]